MFDQATVFHQRLDDLAQQGLNLSAVFDVTELPDAIIQAMVQNQVDVKRFSRLVVLGNGGKRFWDSLEQYGLGGSHPIDQFSLHLTKKLINEISMPADQNLILYPQTDYMIPLQQIGALAGWGTPSPIGNSIHTEYGLWFAFRSAFLTSAPLLTTTPDQNPSPCQTCVEKPCQTACPAEAVFDSVTQFKLHLCLDHRLQAKSPCANLCLARQACPIGTEHRYPDWAINRLYGASLSSIREWRGR